MLFISSLHRKWNILMIEYAGNVHSVSIEWFLVDAFIAFFLTVRYYNPTSTLMIFYQMTTIKRYSVMLNKDEDRFSVDFLHIKCDFFTLKMKCYLDYSSCEISCSKSFGSFYHSPIECFIFQDVHNLCSSECERKTNTSIFMRFVLCLFDRARWEL